MFACLAATARRARPGVYSEPLLFCGPAAARRSYKNGRRKNVSTQLGKAPTPSHGNPARLKFKSPGSEGIEMSNTTMELLYGNSPIKAAMAQGRREIYGLYYQGGFMGDEPRNDMSQLIDMARAQIFPVKEVSKADMTDAIYGANHQGVLLKVSRIDATRLRNLGPLVGGRYSVDLVSGVVELEPRRKFPLLVCLEGIQDERNLGSIIRTALFFGADGVLLSGRDACRPLPIVSKTSAGAMECIPIYKSNEMPKVLAKARENGWAVACTTVRETSSDSGEHTPLDRVSKLSGPTVLVLGSESRGVSPALQSLSDIDVHIPMRSDVPSYIDSLNVGVAAGVILSAVKFVGE